MLADIVLAQGMVENNGAAVFECDSLGYVAPAQYCCEIGRMTTISCCKNDSLRFELDAGIPTGFQSTVRLPTTLNSVISTILNSSISTRVRLSSSMPTRTSVSSSIPIRTSPAIQSSASTSSADTGSTSSFKVAIGVAVPIYFVTMAAVACCLWFGSRSTSRADVGVPLVELPSAMQRRELSSETTFVGELLCEPPELMYMPQNCQTSQFPTRFRSSGDEKLNVVNTESALSKILSISNKSYNK